MEKFNKNSIITVLGVSIVVFGISVLAVLVLTGPIITHAATAPSLGTAATYGIVSSTFTNTNTSPQTIITGGICYTTPPVTAPLTMSSAPVTPCDPGIGTAQTTALADLNGQSCTSLGTDVVLSGTYTPGCYSASGSMDITLNTTVTLNGAGVYIFRAGGALTTGANSTIVLTGGATAGNVFWAPVGATTLGANAALSATPTFVGNILDAAGVTLGHFANLTGRILAFGGTVTTDANTITVPSTLTVIKTVVNDSGGSTIVSGFTVNVKSAGTHVSGSPASGAASPGTTYSLTAGSYVVSEDANASYAQSFSGDCDASGNVTLATGDAKTCTITNNDIAVVPSPPSSSSGSEGSTDVSLFESPLPVPPLIDVVKVPSPLSLPLGPGPVTYTYTVRNVGLVPMSNVTMVGDTCSPIVLTAGDRNENGKLDVNETWVHHCTITLAATHTNTVVATGWGSGLSAIDVASATVVVGVPIVPPLIHLEKKPDVFVLPMSGPVTYTYTVTNPGTAALSNVSVVDNKCSPVSGHSGDVNGNNMLETLETWTYTCSMNLTTNTVNTGRAEGSANGLTAIDLALATVVVSAPTLPNTGMAPGENVPWDIVIPTGIVAFSLLLYVVRRKPTT